MQKNLHFPRAVSLICDPWTSCIQKKVFFFTKKAISDHVYILCSSKLDSDLKIASDSVFLPSNWLKSQAICLTAYKTETKFLIALLGIRGFLYYDFVLA